MSNVNWSYTKLDLVSSVLKIYQRNTKLLFNFSFWIGLQEFEEKIVYFFNIPLELHKGSRQKKLIESLTAVIPTPVPPPLPRLITEGVNNFHCLNLNTVKVEGVLSMLSIIQMHW